MKENVDIHPILSTPDDMTDHHEDPYEASETLNMILHMTYDKADSDIDVDTLERKLQEVWEKWHLDSNLCDVDTEDLSDWVDHLLNT